jgi:hypothetical protein
MRIVILIKVFETAGEEALCHKQPKGRMRSRMPNAGDRGCWALAGNILPIFPYNVAKYENIPRKFLAGFY